MNRIHDGLKRIDPKGVPHYGNGTSSTQGQIEPPTASDGISLPMDAIPSSHKFADSDARVPQTRMTTWSPNSKIMLRFDSDESVRGTEEFRALRSQLYQLRERSSLRKVLVASALPREGRSFVAANLAQVMACQQGCRTLLLDADLRTPSLHSTLGTSVEPGLSDYLLGEAEECDVIRRGQIENLYFVSAGRPVSGTSELLSNGRLKLLLDGPGSIFDWIIIDSTAAMPVSDSGILANHCDGALVIVRANSTPFDIVRKAREKLRPERILGVVLNDIRPEPTQDKPIDRLSTGGIKQEWKLGQIFSSSEPQA